MPLKIIGAGFPRTGTVSLKVALEQLGFGPCYHMSELYNNMPHVPAWIRAYDGDAIDWEEIFSNYAATTDMPGCALYQELADYYPDAKVILTLRDPDAWCDSYLSTMGSSAFQSLMGHSPATGGLTALFEKISKRSDWGSPGRFGNRTEMKKLFNEHATAVCKNIPSERLLIYSLTDGWDPLCAFLQRPVPEIPFPHLNTREQFLAMVRDYSRGGPPESGVAASSTLS